MANPQPLMISINQIYSVYVHKYQYTLTSSLLWYTENRCIVTNPMQGCDQMVKILYQDMQPYKTKWGSFALEMSCWMTTKEMKLLFSCHLLRCASYQCLWRLSSTASKLQTFIILLYKRLALSNSNNICN